jgi:dihydroorotase
MQKSLHNKTVDILVVDGFIKKIAVSLPNSDETEEIKLIISMYHKVGLTAAFRLVNQGEERETIVNGLSVAAKVALRLLLCNQLLPYC